MARDRFADSATNQFFFNVQDNPALDEGREVTGGAGYAVFGRVVWGMETLDRIYQIPTGRKLSFTDVPINLVVIESVTVMNREDL